MCARRRDESCWKTKNELFFFLTFFFILVINTVETSIIFNPCVPLVSGGTDEAILNEVSLLLI